MIPEERRRKIARLVREAGSITVALLESEFGISPMTARRDLMALEEEGRVRRTHGGAVLPEYAGHEDSFWYRLDEAVEAKERLVDAAVGLLEPGASIFLDSSTTSYYVARRILREGPQVTLLTNSVPVMELFMKNEAPRTDVAGRETNEEAHALFCGAACGRDRLGELRGQGLRECQGCHPRGFPDGS